MARLQITRDGGHEGSYELPAGRILVGRSDDCDLQILDQHVSRTHAIIRLSVAGFVLEDRGGRNGTRINGRRVNVSRLYHRDVIQFGRFLAQFLEEEDEAMLGPNSPPSFESPVVSEEAANLAIGSADQTMDVEAFQAAQKQRIPALPQPRDQRVGANDPTDGMAAVTEEGAGFPVLDAALRVGEPPAGLSATDSLAIRLYRDRQPGTKAVFPRNAAEGGPIHGDPQPGDPTLPFLL